MTRWKPIPPREAARLEEELRRELPPGHVLDGRSVRAIAHCLGSDDVAFDVTPGGLCVVHLTYTRERDAGWPYTVFVTELPEDD